MRTDAAWVLCAGLACGCSLGLDFDRAQLAHATDVPLRDGGAVDGADVADMDLPRVDADDASGDIANDVGSKCTTGRADCDGNPANGCEVDLLTSPRHCGACGNDCPMGAVRCCAGRCLPRCN